MDSYEEIVEKCRKNRTRAMLENASVVHAAVLAKNLMISAAECREDVRIVSGCLDKAVYDGLGRYVEEIKSNGRRVQVVLTDKCHDAAASDFMNAVGSGNLFVLDDDYLFFPHFIVVGESAFRIEIDHADKKARANFNDPILGKSLVAAFADALAHSSPYNRANG